MAVFISFVGWYAILLGLTAGVAVVVPWSRFLYPRITNRVKRHLVHPLFFWRLTRWQALLMVTYLSLNVLVLALFLQSRGDLQRRAALLSTINLTPLFVGTPLSPLVDAWNIAPRTHLLWHYLVGVAVTVEGLVHGVTALFQPQESGEVAISGWLVWNPVDGVQLSCVISVLW